MQLQLYWRCRETPYPAQGDFTYRCFTGSDADIAAWISLCKHGLLPPEAGREAYEQLLLRWEDYQLADTLFVEQDGKPVATVTAIVHPAKKQGYVHMVAAHPACRGRGVGALLNQLACARFWEAGCESAWLTTDDFRIPAVKSYLSAGFLPVDCDADMTDRWEKLLTKLGRSHVEMVDEEGRPVKILLPSAAAST